MNRSTKESKKKTKKSKTKSETRFDEVVFRVFVSPAFFPLFPQRRKLGILKVPFFQRHCVEEIFPCPCRATLELEMRINTGGGGGGGNGASSSMMAPTYEASDEGHLSDEASPLRGARAGRLGSSLNESPLATQQQG